MWALKPFHNLGGVKNHFVAILYIDTNGSKA